MKMLKGRGEKNWDKLGRPRERYISKRPDQNPIMGEKKVNGHSRIGGGVK